MIDTSDVRTQLSYQMLDQGFVGIIFSVFSEDKSSKVLFYDF
jgi:BRCA1/BRCA2-containing complex subunit 3